ncbi:uncharacterized protein PAE49_015651 [Odontesthes bonariensis]|uniref:uncharacterized protein LOC142398854 n=1 Tax=Odontesthes bonariensis TaxID=219752 RepID=UPI003F589389
MACLQFIKMASADSTNNESTSLETQLTTRCCMYKLFDENISEAIQKLDEIKEKGRDALAKKSPVFSLVSNADEELQVEAYNLYNQGLKYVFAVEEEPRFSWGGLLVFCLGLLQIVGGALLTVFTCGTLAQVGNGLIIEGISDCISGVEAMVTGEFSWKSWAIQKAISVGLSIITFGVGKLIAKGFKPCKVLIKSLGKKFKSLTKFFSRQTADGLSVVAKANMKNAVKHVAKKVVEEIITYGLGKAEEEILKQILNKIKSEVQKGITDNVKSNIEKKPLATLVDSIILSHLQDKDQLNDLLSDKSQRSDLLAIFRQLSLTAIQPFHADLNWQNKLNSSLITVIDAAKAGAKAGAKGKVWAILSSIQAIHYMTLAGDAIAAVLTLSSKFFSNLQEELNKFKKEKKISEKVMVNDLSPSDTEMLKAFKQDLAKVTSDLLADALVEVFHQKFSGHIVSRVQSEVNGVVRKHVRSGLKSDRTDEKLRAGQNNRYITNMPVNLNSKVEGDAGKQSRSHAERIKNRETVGTILDVRVLSEATGTKVVILTEDKRGRLNKMQEVNPSTKPASQTVTLIYRPTTSQYPSGHYDVRINNETMIIEGKGNSCLFHALARGMKPKACEEKIALEADHLRSLEADTLLRHPGHWEPFIKRKVWTETLRGGDWYMAEGAAPKLTKKQKEICMKEVGGVGKYKLMQKHQQKRKMGQFINADHQPPVSCIRGAITLNQNSKLATAMLEVATNSSPLNHRLIPGVKKSHGGELPAVFVPADCHHEFPSTKSPAFRKLLTETISKDNVVDSFKLTILGSMPRFQLNSTKGFPDFKKDNRSKFQRDVFENSFQKHSEKMVDNWFKEFRGKDVMTQQDCDTIKTWINNKDYNNQNDPLRNKVADLL